MASEWSLCCHRETFKVRVSSGFSSMNQQLVNDPLKQQTQLSQTVQSLHLEPDVRVFCSLTRASASPRANTLVKHVGFCTCHSQPLSRALICAVSGPKCATIRARGAALQSLQVSKLLRRSTFLEPRRPKEKCRRARRCVHVTRCTRRVFV